MNVGHMLGAEEHGSSSGKIKNEVVRQLPATKLVDSLLYLGIAMADGGRFAVDVGVVSSAYLWDLIDVSRFSAKSLT